MSRATTDQLIQAAKEGRYAVPAINVVDDLSMRAVCAAADAASSPLIVQTSVKTVRALGADYLAYSFGRAADRVDVPVSLHLDHCPDRAVVTECLQNGWSSVLFDASDRDFNQAMWETGEVVTEARALGATVEAEIENIAGVEDEIGTDLEGYRYPVEAIVEFVRTTRCDFFAPALGTAHGTYKTAPVLDPGRSAALCVALDVPLVLHGGSGLSAAEFAAFIHAGCAKINISTSLKLAYLKSALAHLDQARAENRWDPPTLFAAIDAGLRRDVGTYFEWFGSIDRAADSH